jgi:hypothetical protein
MPMLLGDLLLFFCLATWVTGIVIAIASLLRLTGCLLGVDACCLPLAAYRAPNPASVEPLPRRGFNLTLCVHRVA